MYPSLHRLAYELDVASNTNLVLWNNNVITTEEYKQIKNSLNLAKIRVEAIATDNKVGA